MNQEIIKSSSDDREYRYVRLQNDLKVILVSDEEAEKSSACLFVGTGSLNDPLDPNRQG